MPTDPHRIDAHEIGLARGDYDEGSDCTDPVLASNADFFDEDDDDFFDEDEDDFFDEDEDDDFC